MKVLSICDHGGVSEFYRSVTPYRLLAEAGYIELTQNNGHNPALVDHLHEFEAVVFSRPDSWQHSYLLLAAKQAGLRVIVDVDDNLLLIPPSIGVYDAWHRRGTAEITERLWHFKRNIRLADVFTISTAALGQQLCEGRPHRLRSDYLILPNMILAKNWQCPAPESKAEADAIVTKPPGEIWIGWWGIYNHWDDWRDIAPYIEPIILKRPQVKLVILGMPELAHLFQEIRRTGQMIIGPFVSPDELGTYRALIKQFDIALAPTNPCPFNESKSDLKILQYGAAGLPVIASKTTYDHWRDWAIVLDKPQKWGRALEMLLDQPAKGRLMGRELQKQILTWRTYERTFNLWLEPLRLKLNQNATKISYDSA